MNFKEKISYQLVSKLVIVLGLVPFSKIEVFSKKLGIIWFALDKKHRNIAIDNILIAYGQDIDRQRAENLAKDVFKNCLRMVFEHAWFNRLPTDYYPRYFIIRGQENLDRAYAKGRGVILISGHIGNWELFTGLHNMLDYQFCAVYKRVKNRGLDRYILEKRAGDGLELVPVHGAFREIRSLLANGYIAGLVADQNVKRKQAVFVDFFRRKTAVNKNIAKLAMVSKAPLVPAFILRKNGGFLFKILPEVPVETTGDPEKDLESICQAFTSTIEEYVKKYPQQWFWIHNRWRTRPMEEKNEETSGGRK